LNTAQSKAAQSRKFEYPSQEFRQRTRSCLLATIGTEMHSREYNLLIPAGDERLDFRQDVIGSCAPARASDGRYDAIGAARITPVLNLDKRTSLAAGPAHRRKQVVPRRIQTRANYFSAGLRTLIEDNLRQPLLVGIHNHQAHARD